MRYAALLVVFTVSCSTSHRGDLDERCNSDGTCNHATLQCNRYHNECQVSPAYECRNNAECFCDKCVKQCALAGSTMQSCVHTDTSVWGSQPTACECK